MEVYRYRYHIRILYISNGIFGIWYLVFGIRIVFPWFCVVFCELESGRLIGFWLGLGLGNWGELKVGGYRMVSHK